MLLRDRMGPSLDGGTFDFDSQSAVSADQVVVMACPLATAAIQSLAISADQDIDVTGAHHRLQ